MRLYERKEDDKWYSYAFITTEKMGWNFCLAFATWIYPMLVYPRLAVAENPCDSCTEVTVNDRKEIFDIPEASAIRIHGVMKEETSDAFSGMYMWFTFFNQTHAVYFDIAKGYVDMYKNKEGEPLYGLSEDEKLHLFDKLMSQIELRAYALLETRNIINDIPDMMVDALCNIKDFGNEYKVRFGIGKEVNLSDICDTIIKNHNAYLQWLTDEAQRLKDSLPKAPVFHIDFSDEYCNYMNSKVGGSFYWPDDNPPELIFLAQFNFAEFPENDIFPKSGMLQFFVKDDDTNGLLVEDGYKVVFHDTIDGSEHQSKEWEYNPTTKEQKMLFTQGIEMMSMCDYRFERYKKGFEHIPDELLWKLDIITGDGSKILGFPAFTQDDPRYEGTEPEKYDMLLFQLDSYDSPTEWGDGGIANFFINSEHLKNGDFSDVLYNWDCY